MPAPSMACVRRPLLAWKQSAPARRSKGEIVESSRATSIDRFAVAERVGDSAVNRKTFRPKVNFVVGEIWPHLHFALLVASILSDRRAV